MHFGEHDVSERVIVENELAYAFPTNIPIVPGHVLICPKRKVARLEDLTEDEKKAVEDLRVRIKSALERLFGAEGFNYAWNDGAQAGQSVPHYHLHVLPRKAGDTGVHQYEPRQFVYRPGTRATSPDEELIGVAHSIRDALQ